MSDDKTKKLAGVTRPELFTSMEHTGKLRAHALRATFVTCSIASGKPQTWIRDRTAHKTMSMVDRYRRTARQFEELDLGALGDWRR
jgi:integrase